LFESFYGFAISMGCARFKFQVSVAKAVSSFTFLWLKPFLGFSPPERSRRVVSMAAPFNACGVSMGYARFLLSRAVARLCNYMGDLL